MDFLSSRPCPDLEPIPECRDGVDFLSSRPCPDLGSIPELRDGVDFAVPHFSLPLASVKQPKSLATSEGNHCHSSCEQNGQSSVDGRGGGTNGGRRCRIGDQ